MTNDWVYPEDEGTNSNIPEGEGDYANAANFAAWADSDNDTDYVTTGLTFTVDSTVPDFDLSAGRLKIQDNAATQPSKHGGETRDQGVTYTVEVASRSGIALTDAAVNHVFVTFAQTDDDALSIVVNTDGTSPSTPSLKIGEIDTNDGSKTLFNRQPDGEFGRLDVRDVAVFHDGGSFDGNIDVATGSALRDGSGVDRYDFNSSRSTIYDPNGDFAYEANTSRTRIHGASGRPISFFDREGSFVGVQYDTDPTAGVLRTPGAGARIESDGSPSSGDGAEILWDDAGSKAVFQAYDRSASSYRQVQVSGEPLELKGQGGLVDMSGPPADLRLAAGQAIEDGSGTPRLDIDSNLTDLNTEDGDVAIRGNRNAGGGQIYRYSDGQDLMIDQDGGYTAVGYTSSTSAPGTLELTNADLDMGSNAIENAISATIEKFSNSMEDSLLWVKNPESGDSAGAGVRVSSDGSNFQLRSYGQSHSSRPEEGWLMSGAYDTDIVIGTRNEEQMRFNAGGAVSMERSLQIATGQSIEDGSGNRRLTLDSGATRVRTESGRQVLRAREGNNSGLVAYSNQNITVYDNEASQDNIKYSAGDPGTLELTNADLDMGSNAIENASSVDTDRFSNAIEEPSDVTGSRSIGDLEQNTTGHNIFVSVVLVSDGTQELNAHFVMGNTSSSTSIVDDVILHAADISDTTAYTFGPVEVPAGGWYGVEPRPANAATLDSWREWGRTT